MTLRIEDMGEAAYGGLVQAGKWLDDRRIEEGKITEKELLKQWETYAYLLPGGFATVASAFGFMPRQGVWLEHVSHGFIYDFPRFMLKAVNSMRNSGTSTKAAAVREAQRIVQERSRAKQLGAGRATSRTYAPEFAEATLF